MKKWIFITTCTVVVLLSTVNVYRVLGDWNTPFLSMLKLEQLAYGEGGNTGGEGGSVNDCDIFLYNRNYAEATERVKITFNIKLQGYIEFAGKKQERSHRHPHEFRSACRCGAGEEGFRVRHGDSQVQG